jgi:hypothetical protein
MMSRNGNVGSLGFNAVWKIGGPIFLMIASDRAAPSSQRRNVQSDAFSRSEDFDTAEVDVRLAKI